MPNPAPGEDELFIHLDTAGLAALLKAVESAMVEGRGHLTLGEECGLVASRGGSPDPFARATVKFVHHVRPPGESGQPDPEPLPPQPILELQD